MRIEMMGEITENYFYKTLSMNGHQNADQLLALNTLFLSVDKSSQFNNYS